MFETGSKVGRQGQYVIQKKLGQGAFGAVYLADDTVSGIPVAIKTIPPEVSRNNEELDDLKSNFQLVYKLKHPHIAALNTLEHDQTLDEYLLIMEYVQGESLRACRKRQSDRKIGVEESVRILKQLASAVDYSHMQSILHRDIKPENVIVSAAGEVKLLDFGLASQIRSTVLNKSATPEAALAASASVMAGTRPYMAPEVFKAKNPGQAADIYALGVLFYELVSGFLPFQSDDPVVLKQAVCEENPDSLEELTKNQNKIVQKVLAKTPNDRYKTAKEFVDALEATLQPTTSPLKFIIPGLAILGLISGGIFYKSQQLEITPVSKLFTQLEEKYQSRNIKNIALLPRFLDCNESIYETYKTKMVNQSGIKILERKMLSKVLKDQDIANLYNQNMEKVTELGLNDLTQSQAIVVGKCINNQLYMRLIESNTGTLLGASEVKVNNALDNIATANTTRTTQSAVIEPKTTQISKGELKLSSIPSTVNWYMDGAFMGTTPSTKDDLEPGKHLLKLKKDGYQTREEAVMIRSGETTSLQFKLKQLITTGSLRLSSDPTGANWYMNNILMGTTPDTAKNLKAGRYEIQFKHEGYKNKEKTVFITKGKTSSLNANLTQLVTEFGLTVNTTPYDATVKILNINPKYYDDMRLKSGDYHIEVSKWGYNKVKQWVTIGGADKTVTVRLKKPESSWADPTTGMEFVKIKKGCFQMGSPSNEEGRYDGEEKQHRVCIERDYWLGKYEVTQGQWKKVMGNNPAYFKKKGKCTSEKCPIETVSFNEVQNYIKKLNRQGNAQFILPTEAQWEYACRSGGKAQKYCGGNNVGTYAWYSSNSGGKTHPVGGKTKNGLGLFDMSGNVWEWTCSKWVKSYDGSEKRCESTGSGAQRVLRGGSWYGEPRNVRSAVRHSLSLDDRNGSLGFRLLRTNP